MDTHITRSLSGLFIILIITFSPISLSYADNTKDLTAQQKAIEKILNTSTSAGDLSVKLGIDPVCVPLSQDEFLCQWDDPHPETKLYINVSCYIYVNPSRTKVKWDAQNRCRIHAPLPLSSSSVDNTENTATRQKEIEEIVNASTSAGDLSVKLGIAPDCDALSPDEFLCQWDDYHAEGSTIRVFCFMFVDQSRKKVTWDAQNRCRTYSTLPLSLSYADNTKDLTARRKKIEKILNISTSAGDLSVKLGIAPDCGPLIDPQIPDEILCQWYDYRVEGSTISVFCFMFLNRLRTKAIWDAKDGCRIYSPLPPEPNQ